ncbi:MAG TPA: ABC transporter permease [Thermoanaerobaculia bacterium]
MRPEHWWFTAPLRVRSLFRRARVEDEMDEELQFHLEHKIEEGVSRGLSPEEARAAALRAMGGLEQRKEEIRDTRRVHWLTDFVDDVRYAARSLRRTPGLTAFIVLTIALGVGMTATPLSMLDALIFRPYPVPHPGSVVTLVSTSRDNAFDSFSYPEYRDIRDHVRSYDGVVAHSGLMPVGFSPRAVEIPRIRGALLVSGNFFRSLDVEPRIGRGFRDDEDRVPGRDAVVVLGADFWKSEFGGDSSVVGRTIRLNGRDFTVIGVAPEGFTSLYIFDRPDVFVPLAMSGAFTTNPKKSFFSDRDDRELVVRGRLRRDARLGDARSELESIAKDFAREYPSTNRGRGATVRTMLEMRTQPGDANWKFAVIFTTLAFVVLLVACTNAAGLLLSRARARTREIAVRLAIGAGRFRLIRLLLTESLVLALLGGACGVAIGYAGIALLQRLSIPAEIPIRIPFRMDERVLLASFFFSVLSAVFCGLAPALQGTRMDLVNGLKAADVEEPGSRRFRGRNALVAAQVAMSLMLLAASFVMYRGFHHSLSEGLDFARDAKDHVLLARFDPRLAQYDADKTRRFYRQLVERIREKPGVRSAALCLNPPLGLDGWDLVTFVPENFDMPRDREVLDSRMDAIDGDYFRTMGIPIVRGRDFRGSDDEGAPRVAIVNEHFARHYWPNAEAVGRRIRLGGRAGDPVEIVGVAQDIHYGDTFGGRTDFVYMPVAQHPVSRLVLMVRADGDPLQLLEPVQEVVRSLDPNMPMLRTMSYAELYRYSVVVGPGIAIKLVGTLGAVALLLAIAGLYGLVAYNVSRRTREIGIRMAIGARPRDVLRLVMGKGLTLVAIGTLFGLAMGFAVERFMNSMLFSMAGTDVTVYLVVVPAMLLVTMLATWIPARRATRIPPTLALRCE